MYKTVNPFTAPAKVSNLFLNLKFPLFYIWCHMIYEEGTWNEKNVMMIIFQQRNLSPLVQEQLLLQAGQLAS